MTKLLPLIILCLSLSEDAWAGDKPLRVYILAGQSNMVGTGNVETINYIGKDPATAPLLEKMLNEQGEPRTCDRVWISSLNGKYRTEGAEGFGKLTPGYGFRKNPTQAGDCIGPEYTFGITMEENYDGPVLIIKTAWGGKSLHLEFRPPSAGSYTMPEEKAAKLQSRRNGSLERIQKENERFEGKYYRSTIAHVRKVLSDIKRVYPNYDSDVGYELKGFVWFQGWNDYSALLDYPESNGDRQYERYSDLLANFIRDVRNDLSAPDLPFVIGVMGVNGNHTTGCFTPAKSKPRMERFRRAMAAPAMLREFGGNVVAVKTAKFWDDEIARIGLKQNKIKRMRRLIDKKSKDGPNADGTMTADQKKQFLENYANEVFTPEELRLKDKAMGQGGFVHYYGMAKFHAQAGAAFAKALLEMNGQ